jgi:hypothetical protein
MAQMLRSALQCGMWLFAQPSSFVYDWERKSAAVEREREWERERDGTAVMVVVTPALVKVADGGGRALARGQIIVGAAVKRV